MSAPNPLRHHLVERALASTASSLAPSGAASWHAILRNGKEVRALIALKDGWLHCASELSRSVPRGDHWRLLELNALLPTPARVSLAAGRRHPWLRVDVPLGDGEATVGAQVTRACTVLLASVERLAHPDAEDDSPPGREADDALAIAAVGEALGESGWAHRVRDDGSIEVELGTRREPGRARVRLTAGELHLEAVVAPAVALAPASQAAIGTLLLLGTDDLHCVRGTVRRGGADWSVALEARATGPPSPQYLDLALIALGLATDALGGEVRALLYEPTAVEYLRTLSGER